MATEQESEGQEKASQSGDLPEGAEISQGQPAGSPLGDGVQAFPFQSQGAQPLANFDVLAALGEAEQFALSVKSFIDQSPFAYDPRWRAISGAMDVAIAAHDKLNSTPTR